jgi:hypothetical protein
MALKNVQRITFSLPKATVLNLEMKIPKNKRSKFLADLINNNLKRTTAISLEEEIEFWERLSASAENKTEKTAVELLREDRYGE